MEQRTALWAVVILVAVALGIWFTRPTPIYTAIPFGGESKMVMIINTITGEAVKYCTRQGCMEMPQKVRPHPRN